MEIMNQQVLNKILRKKILWAEIKAKEQEYGRMQKQIYELEQAQKDISFEIQKRLQESQDIADDLLEVEYKAIKELELKFKKCALCPYKCEEKGKCALKD